MIMTDFTAKALITAHQYTVKDKMLLSEFYVEDIEIKADRLRFNDEEVYFEDIHQYRGFQDDYTILIVTEVENYYVLVFQTGITHSIVFNKLDTTYKYWRVSLN